jgi:hypothetical protein
MFDQTLLDTVARSMAIHFSMNRQPHMSGDPLQRLGSQELRRLTDATHAALEALCEVRPDIAAVLQGKAVVMPPEASKRMLDAHWEQTGESEAMRPRTHAYMMRYYRAMVAVSPYVAESDQPRQGYISPELLTSLQDYSDSLDKTKVNQFLELYRKPSQDSTS